MKAMTLSRRSPAEERPLVLAELPEPSPGADEVLVRVRACGVCRTDLHVVEGDLPERRPAIVPGHQIVGEVVRAGERVEGLRVGDRVGIAWLHRTCGHCRFCVSARENLCDLAEFTGWTVPGGFAEYTVAPGAFCYRLPDGFADLQAAPLLCAGIIGFRALEMTGLVAGRASRGARLGIYGFGAAGHVVIQLARARGIDVYVFTRDQERHQALARELGALWVGGAGERSPLPLDAAIIFAPAGELVPRALESLDKGGRLVLGGIHMSQLPPIDYRLLYGERVVRSVANNTRDDGRRFLAEAASIPVATRIEVLPLEQANDALIALKRDAIRGAAVLLVR
ncbi:MAG TPA: zinc-dependent alcohol dehydrogenase family protein [Candidatus Bathyarchaeia archaeon]|nr:zinc-dependent alcohol dehydrogenase family protein [Candidatus Bathyarchaeia archaeon]